MPILCSALCDHGAARARMSIGKRRDGAEGNRRGQSEERVTKENKEIRLLFPTVVQESFIDDAAEVNRALLKAIDDIKAETPNGLPSSWSCTLYTTIESQNTLHLLAPFQQLADYITGKANDFAKTLKVRLDDYPLEMRSMWVNVYGKGHSQEIHNHANSVFSGVYYVKAPPRLARPADPWSHGRHNGPHAGHRRDTSQLYHGRDIRRGRQAGNVPKLVEAQR